MSMPAGTSYEPGDHSLSLRQTLAGWAIFAALLVIALAANIGRADSYVAQADRLPRGVMTCWSPPSPADTAHPSRDIRSRQAPT